MRLRRIAGLMTIMAACSYADTITITHTGDGSGQVGTTTFTNAAFTIIDIGNTADRTSLGFGWFIDDTSASIAISGVGSFNFLTPTRTFVNNTAETVGFSRGSGYGLDLYDGTADAAFANWDMLSSIGPISGSASLLQWSFSPVNTDGGVLVFNDGTSASVFTATVSGSSVPEPSSLLLIVVGLVGIVGLSLRRGTARLN